MEHCKVINRLRHKLEFYIPFMYMDDGQVVKLRSDQLAYVEGFISRLLKYFGGCTIIESMGYYTRKDGAVVALPTKIAQCYTNNSVKENSGLWDTLDIHWLCKKLEQDCIAVVIDNEMIWVN